MLLVPKYSEIRSRKDIDLSYTIKNVSGHFGLPIVSSPMDTVTEDEMCAAILRTGGLGVIHRYNTIQEQCEIAAKVYEEFDQENSNLKGKIAAAIGVSGDYLERAKALHDAGVKIFCVDVAHGHHLLMKDALTKLRSVFGELVHIMAGNVATLEAFNDLSDWGADSVRVGIGGGSICSTRIMTGHGVPTLQSVLDCSASDRSALLVADGGIKTSGDIVKCLAAGADLVMLGSLLAGTDETPGEFYFDAKEKTFMKTYRGMASVEAQINWRGHTASVEGVSSSVHKKGPVKTILSDLEQGIRSGLSYSGSKSLSDFRAQSSFIRQTVSGATESSTHINRR